MIIWFSVYFAMRMLSKAQIKHIRSLHTKKKRIEHAQFIVEGQKGVSDLLAAAAPYQQLLYTAQHTPFIQEKKVTKAIQIREEEFEKISTQKQPEGILAIVDMPRQTAFEVANKKYIALDQIRDPGNLGTIIRLADWFGVEAILCSHDCVDVYNPKVIQASMGSIFHTPVYYEDLNALLGNIGLPIYAAMLTGSPMYELPPTEQGVLLIGNEANGISNELLAHATTHITIPARGQAESLNAAIACGILTAFLFR